MCGLLPPFLRLGEGRERGCKDADPKPLLDLWTALLVAYIAV
jgi:hypothetical protein